MILDEVDTELLALRNAQTVSDVKEEAMNSLSGRLHLKKGALGKRAARDKSKSTIDNLDAVSNARAKLVAIGDDIKAVNVFQKQKSRKGAGAIGDKMHALKASGVTTDMVPSCHSA